MYCRNCKTHSTKVKDTCQSHTYLVKGKGKEYLDSWGKEQLSLLGVKPGLPYTVRALECTNCGSRYRTLEIPTMCYPPKKRKWSLVSAAEKRGSTPTLDNE